jgi:hypothetical protein
MILSIPERDFGPLNGFKPEIASFLAPKVVLITPNGTGD